MPYLNLLKINEMYWVLSQLKRALVDIHLVFADMYALGTKLKYLQ